MLNPFKFTKSFFIEPVVFYYNIVRGFGALRIEDIDPDDEHGIIINDKFNQLYCLEIAGAGENISFIPDRVIDSLSVDFKDVDDGELVWVLLKDGLYKKNLVFSSNKDLIEQINYNNSFKLLAFNEIFDRILALYFNNEYDIVWYKKKLKQKYNIDLEDEYKNPLNSINSLIIERVNRNYNVNKYYQAVSYNNDLEDDEIKFDIDTFFNVDFKGALYTKIIFNKDVIKNELESQKFNTMGQFKTRDKKHLKKLIKSIDTHNRLMINTTLCVFDDFGKNIATQIERCSNTNLDLSIRDSRDLNNKTPILKYNNNFSKIINREFLYKYISYNSKLDSDKPHLVGTNKDDTFVNFGFKKATANNSIPKQHTILLGTSGSGKTQAANDILKQLLGYDYSNKKLHNIGETNHVIFDIKDSFYNQVKKIKEDFPKLVDMNDFDKNSFTYNIVDCDVIKKGDKVVVVESDLDFSSTLISLILSSNGNTDEALSSSESEQYKSAIKEIYKKGYFDRLPIVEIRDSHEVEYKSLRDLGYDEYTLFDDIKEKGYEKFNKPLLHNIINHLKQSEINYRSNGSNLKASLIESLINKLETIKAMGIFSSYSKLEFKDKEIIYFRTDSIVGNSDYGYLIFAMQSIISKQIKAKQHKKRIAKQDRPYVFFWFEEARNIFENELFREKQVFERIINEWRSFDMVFFPITQEPEHIPDNILNGFEIKMILTSGDDEEEKANLIDNLSSRLAIGNSRKQILKTLPKYTIFIMYGDGAFTFKFKNDAVFREIVDT